jgi:hypothetical protein
MLNFFFVCFSLDDFFFIDIFFSANIVLYISTFCVRLLFILDTMLWHFSFFFLTKNIQELGANNAKLEDG